MAVGLSAAVVMELSRCLRDRFPIHFCLLSDMDGEGLYQEECDAGSRRRGERRAAEFCVVRQSHGEGVLGSSRRAWATGVAAGHHLQTRNLWGTRSTIIKDISSILGM